MLRKLWRSLILCVLCFSVVIGCTRSTPEPMAKNDGRITIGTTASISTLDPADAYSIFAGNLLYNLGDRLYRYKPGTSELEPQLATALPKVSADQLTYTIPLRRGIVFHDGEPFNAKAMEFSLRRFIQNGGSPAFLLADAVDSISAQGEDQLSIKLKKPFAGFPALLAFSGACAVSPKAYKIEKGSFNSESFVGTGAYKLAKFGTDSIVLDAFEQYWGDKPANRGVNVQFFSSPANLFNAFRTGAIDVAYQGLALEQIRNLKENASDNTWKMVERSGSGIDYLTLNMKSPPLDRLEVRQAIAAIMDRPILGSRIFQGQVEPLYSLIPSSLREQKPVFKEYGDRNIEKARNLLTKAGYSESNPLKVEFWYRSNISNDQLAAVTLKAVVQKYLGNLMQLQLNSVESVTAYRNLDKGAYPIFLLDWTPDFLDADNYIQPFMECAKGSPSQGCEEGSSALQGSYYYSDRVNQLIGQSRKERNPEARRQMFEQLQDALAKDVPFIPLWQNKDVLFVQKNIQDATLEVTQKVPFGTMKKA
ncbi:ABC transporter substrate-binding protein [Leptolyngbya sp. FACHB-17]|uniref:ABC transporter substrate-binding protein n=1 Tax=unclassified Leptolyngbya TaxID=2650499 RepID=UPI0016802F2C|nr:ABC transporter substrate-binding protein [Leptolyngbya sp. FACHB-17]MBD2079899.1 peptide ABC transporter substrate-binding protein [Leptolyngbya sp. FACHB-17]